MGLIYGYLAAHASANSDKAFCIVDDGRRLTFGEAKQTVDHLADFLLKNCGPQPNVAVQLEDPLETCLIALAVNKIAGCAVPLSSDLLPHQVDGFLTAGQVNCLIGFKRNAKHASTVRSNIDFLPVSDLQQSLTNPNVRRTHGSNVDYHLDQPYLITFSSGSTGNPKPLMIRRE